MGLLNAGRLVTPVGSSDTHDVARHFVGQARTYIRCDDREPGKIDVESAVNNFLQGHVMVSYGLLAEMTVDGKYRSGELAAPAGDTLAVEVLEGKRPVAPVVVAAVNEEILGTSVVMSRPALEALLGEGGAISGAYLAVDDRQATALYRTLKQTPAVGGVLVREATVRGFEQTIAESFWISISLMVLFACVIAAGVIYNGSRVLKRRLAASTDVTEGLALPWPKTHDKVFIQRGKVCVWTGWSHHGKTAMLKQCMASAVYQGEKVCIASMEETVSDVFEDVAYLCCGTSTPKLSDVDEFTNFVAGKLWLYDQEGSINSKRIQAVIRYAAKELGITQFVIDSLMMLKVGRDDYDAQAEFVGDLKSITKDTNCTIHLVAHMRKREGKTGEDVPGSQHDISGGHEIGSKADYVFNVWRDKQRKDPNQPAAISWC